MKNTLFIILLLFGSTLFSQETGTIKGTVTDKAMNNEPMLFANVQLKGIDTNFQTNFHGNFEITNVPAGTYTLVVSYAGYNTNEIIVNVNNNEISELQTGLARMQVSFDDVAGLDAALEDAKDNSQTNAANIKE